MVLPLFLLFIATLAAAVVAYGIHPNWAQYSHGLDLILLTRRLQWPIIAVALIACVALLVLIISGKRRAWWLIGLGPVLALFAHRFATDPDRAFAITDAPVFVSADRANFVGDEDWVVGVVFDGEAYAYPYSSLYASPVVVQAEREHRLMLMWSAFANRAVAVTIDRSLKPREMEIVSIPANALLLYNARLGQFINGVTGLTNKGERPAGFGQVVRAEKTTWRQWRAAHPQTNVWSPPGTSIKNLPTGPVLPYYPMPAGSSTLTSGTRVTLVCTTQPTAVLDDAVVADRPCNLVAGDVPMLLVRERFTGAVRAFERVVKGDLTPKFRGITTAKHPEATMSDADSGSFWTQDGRAVDGPLKGERLKPFDAIDDDVYGDVIQYWYPTVKLVTPMFAEGPAAVSKTPNDGGHAIMPKARKRKKPPAEAPPANP